MAQFLFPILELVHLFHFNVKFYEQDGNELVMSCMVLGILALAPYACLPCYGCVVSLVMVLRGEEDDDSENDECLERLRRQTCKLCF